MLLSEKLEFKTISKIFIIKTNTVIPITIPLLVLCENRYLVIKNKIIIDIKIKKGLIFFITLVFVTISLGCFFWVREINNNNLIQIIIQ